MHDDQEPITGEIETDDPIFTYAVTVTQRNDLHLRPRQEVEEAARKWFGIARDMKSIQDQLAADLETALNACRAYQGTFAHLELPDPNLVTVRQLLTKYKMATAPVSKSFRVIVDGVDITEHPDSIPGDAVETDVIELTGEQYYGTETAELVADEDGQMHLRPVAIEMAPEVDTFSDVKDPDEPIDSESRDWLIEDE